MQCYAYPIGAPVFIEGEAMRIHDRAMMDLSDEMRDLGPAYLVAPRDTTRQDGVHWVSEEVVVMDAEAYFREMDGESVAATLDFAELEARPCPGGGAFVFMLVAWIGVTLTAAWFIGRWLGGS